MSISDNIARVEEQVAAACRRANRPRNAVRLMAVSKTHPAEAILEVHAAGVSLFGENRVQEYAAKQPTLAAAKMFSETTPIRFHLIGPLQSNKAVRAAQLFDGVDTLASLHLAERMNHAAANAGRTLKVLLEIKLSPEPSKHGLEPGSHELDVLLERLPDFSYLQLGGLMTIPPYAHDPEEARPYFRQLRILRDSLAARYPRISLDILSMGMSHDFSIAIEENSTQVRIGTAIFGTRETLDNE